MNSRTLTAWFFDLCFAFALFIAMVGCNSIVSVRVDQGSLPNSIPELKRIIAESKQRIVELEALRTFNPDAQGLSANLDTETIDERIEVQRAILGAAQTKLERLESRIER